jgi:YNFM family putative membrane transporter
MATLGAVDLAVAVAFVLLLPTSRNFTPRNGLGPSHHISLWRGHLRHPRLPFVFAIGCLVMGAFVTVYNYAGFRLMRPPFNLDASETGLIFSAYIFGMVASSSAGFMADKFGRGPVMISGIACAAAGLLFTLNDTLPLTIVGIVLITIGFFITHSVASGWVGAMANGAKGHASSLYLLAYYLGSSFLGSFGGWFWEKQGWSAVVAFSFFLLLCCFVLAMRVWKRTA